MDKNKLFIHDRLKFIIYIKKKKKLLNDNLHQQITKIMNNLNNNFQNKLVSNHLYNLINNELTGLLEEYSLPLNNLSQLLNLKQKLFDIVLKTGTDNFLDLIEFFLDIDINKFNLSSKTINKFYFINDYFSIIKIYKHNKKKSLPTEYDLNILSNLDVINSTTINKKNLSILEHINGALIYLKLNSNIIILTGYFIKDNLNIIKNKININLVSLTNIDSRFKKNYIKHLSVRDKFIYSKEEIIENMKKTYYNMINYQKNNISYIVKDFLNKTILEQLEILTMLLLSEKDEIKYIAYLLYDLINNESYLLKSKPYSEDIYNNLHWSIQKNFRLNLSKFEEKVKNINFNLEDIPYEKRIYLMKCSDYIKNKAIEKFKEINKSNDNSSKSQQYLDSLLKIPFNIFKKEEILDLKDIYESKISTNIDKINNYIKSNNLNLNLLEEKNNFCYMDMVESINKIKKFNNLFFNKDIIENWVKKNKNKDIIDFINTINNELNTNLLKNKGPKKIFCDTLNKFFNNNQISEQIKIKYYDKINLYKINAININISNLLEDWDKFKKKRIDYLNNVDKTLNKAIYSQDDAKNEIKRIIGQWINGKMTGYCLGFEGPPGIGKTSLAKKGIAKCLIDSKGISRPFSFIALGGSSNGSLLEGHNYTYVGSNYGKIIEILIQTKCMNPIIYIDELDKISNTENGKEIIGILTHLTDPSQNDHFSDKYFSGIEFDLSKVLFIFSYNDFSKIDPILADRIHRVKFNYLQKHEKIHISKNYILPELLTNIGYKNNSIKIPDDVISYIINNYTYEAGIRKLKEKINEIIREINLDNILKKSQTTETIINLDYVKNLFSKKPKVYIKKINQKSNVGIVNGLYATSMGLGGIILIQVTKTFNNTKMDFRITGQQGEVMKESIFCAKTISWNLIPEKIKKDINSESTFGIHLHCPEASTPKDGPSAGGAITLALVSLLTNTKVKNDIGLTGEIDLKGNITQIGGLDLKIDGGKYAGLKTILIPEENKSDYDIIKKDNPSILEDINIIFVSNIKQIIEIALEENDIDFNFDL